MATLSSRCRRRLSKRCHLNSCCDSGNTRYAPFSSSACGFNFRSEESEIPDDEPFTLEGLSRYQLNQQLLNTLIEQQDASTMYRRFRAAGELPFGAFGELAWETQRQEMQNLAERVIASRQPGQSMEIDLQCHGVNITGWLQQVQSDGLLRWRPSLLSVAQGCNFGWNTLSTVLAAEPVKAGCWCAKRASGVSRLWRRNRPKRTLISW